MGLALTGSWTPAFAGGRFRPQWVESGHLQEPTIMQSEAHAESLMLPPVLASRQSYNLRRRWAVRWSDLRTARSEGS